jgi:cysteine desulfurase
VALVYVQNEIGTIQPIKELARVLKKQENPPYLLVDAVQAVEYFDCQPESLGADLLVVAPHKFGGPKGIGILYRRLGITLWPLISGGEQEFGLRAGTENVAGVVGAAKAIELIGDAKKRALRRKLVEEKRQIFEEAIQKYFPNIKILGKEVKRAPHISGLAVKDLNAQQALIRLDMAGLSLSMGSACSTRKMRFSKIPKLLKLPTSYEKGFLRVSFSESTSKEEIQKALKILSQKLYEERG